LHSKNAQSLTKRSDDWKFSRCANYKQRPRSLRQCAGAFAFARLKRLALVSAENFAAGRGLRGPLKRVLASMSDVIAERARSVRAARVTLECSFEFPMTMTRKSIAKRVDDAHAMPAGTQCSKFHFDAAPLKFLISRRDPKIKSFSKEKFARGARSWLASNRPSR
jgi:hypothetical protein